MFYFCHVLYVLKRFLNFYLNAFYIYGLNTDVVKTITSCDNYDLTRTITVGNLFLLSRRSSCRRSSPAASSFRRPTSSRSPPPRYRQPVVSAATRGPASRTPSSRRRRHPGWVRPASGLCRARRRRQGPAWGRHCRRFRRQPTTTAAEAEV